MGGKSSDSGSREMIQMQREEADAARAKEAARQGRISSGLERIRQAFEGAPVMRTVGRNFDWASAAPGAGGMGKAALPQGFSWVQGAAPAAAAPASSQPLTASARGAARGQQAVSLR